MKKLILLIFCLLAVAGQAFADLNAEQLKVRKDLTQFLKEEGFQPELDSDGDIKVKIQGTTCFVSVVENNTSPMFITISSYFSKPSEYSPLAVKIATVELNLYKGVKVQILDNSVRIVGEMYVRNSEPFKQAFYKLVDVMSDVKGDLDQEFQNAQKELDQYCNGGSTI
ncbi:MAG: hypothetical protein NC336_02760 [Clostridium sp.]|nr:hypothetical protein [Clostridium sp.]